MTLSIVAIDGRLKKAVLILLPFAIVATCLLGWYWDRIAWLLASRPGAAAVAGRWTLDEDAYGRMADAAAQLAPPGERTRYRASLASRAAPYREVTWEFTPEGYVIHDGRGDRSVQATYTGYPPNMISVRPVDGQAIALVVEEPGRRLLLSLPVLGIPLKPAG